MGIFGTIIRSGRKTIDTPKSVVKGFGDTVDTQGSLFKKSVGSAPAGSIRSPRQGVRVGGFASKAAVPIAVVSAGAVGVGLSSGILGEGLNKLPGVGDELQALELDIQQTEANTDLANALGGLGGTFSGGGSGIVEDLLGSGAGENGGASGGTVLFALGGVGLVAFLLLKKKKKK